jgi:putative addiction module killer protein
VEARPRELRYYQNELGGIPCLEWITSLRDKQGQADIRVKLNRLQMGNVSGCKSAGAGVHELKVHSGPGYRVYFGVDGVHLILLNGGTKNTQAQDIVKAKRNWQDYNA